MEIFPKNLENLEIQRNFDYIQKKFEYIEEKIEQISIQIQKIIRNTFIPTSTPTFTPIPILIKLISFTDIIKKGPIAIGNIILYIKIS
jgi:hypothetical protein